MKEVILAYVYPMVRLAQQIQMFRPMRSLSLLEETLQGINLETKLFHQVNVD